MEAPEVVNIDEVGKDVAVEKEELDPFSYLEANGFTSEKFKIEIRNLPKFCGIRELKKLLNNKLKLDANKIKVPKGLRTWVYVCFRSEDSRQKAINVLNGYKWKGSTLKADSAKAVPDPLVKRRLEDSEEGTAKKVKISEEFLQEQLKDSTIPLWKVPYKDQLEQKEKEAEKIIKNLGYELVQVNPNLKGWINKQRDEFKGMPCEMWPIRHAELADDGYRNKCDFTIGISEATGKPTVGFRTGRYMSGSVSVAPVDDLAHVPKRMKEAAEVFQAFVRESALEVFNSETHQGHWRQLIARYGFKSDQLLLVVGFHPQQLSEAELDGVAKDLTAFFTEGQGAQCRVASLFLQFIDRNAKRSEPNLKHLTGETYITEQLLGRTFRISPTAFFQVNTAGAEVLYRSIGELATLSERTTLLDVCCGTGTIGICLADKCGEVLGLEMSPQAVADAEVNAASNNITNAKYFAGKAEEIMSAVTHRATCPEMVAIVDPPRAGLHRNALVQLRKTRNLNKLVYVSCDPKLALQNMIDLGRAESKVYQRQPFVPVRAVAVDMFPLTSHCELLIYFERLPEDPPADPSLEEKSVLNTS